MRKKLAIKGHSTRGNEIIEILKMLGGKDCGVSGCISINNYFLDTPTHIDAFATNSSFYESHKNEYIFFTLEEFLEKYPFKIGELKDSMDDHIACIITEMRWNELDACVEYHVEFDSNDYGWYKAHELCNNYQEKRYKEMTKDTFRKNFCERCGSQRCSGQEDELEYCERFKAWSKKLEESKEVISGIHLNSCDYADEVELNLGDYEIEVRGKRTYAVKKKPKYPDNYEECVRIAKNIHGYDIHIDVPAYGELMESFVKLLICRDAYWKIAGEQMGLGKPWEPNWTTFEGIPAIFRFRYNIVCDSVKNQHCLLVFPTEEMRDAFYKNFKDLIESCKELL